MASDTLLDAFQQPRRAGGLAFQPLSQATVGGLHDLLAALVAGGEEKSFHPHAFDRDSLDALCRSGPGPCDEYRVATEQGRVVAYGMLRGWSAGFEVPSLGIAVHPAGRGRGVARALMMHLHDVARHRGAVRVRLKVYRDNAPAIRLYTALGYRLEPLNDREFVGFAELARPGRESTA